MKTRYLLPAATVLAAALLAACSDVGATPEETLRTARIETVAAPTGLARREFVGRVEARYSVDLAFQVSGRLAEKLAAQLPNGAIWANQFDTIANRRAHIVGTAEEIWQQMEGRIDGFTCAVGTGGTLAGVGMGLKAHDENIRIALSDPHGAALYDYYAHGELKSEGNSVAEGIGQGRITANLEGAPVDTQFRISDQEGWDWVRRLLDEEGLCLGLSSGINVAGAVHLARQLGPGSRVATILCDTGFRYLSTLHSPEWRESKGLR